MISVYILDGTSLPVHEANEREGVEISEETAPDYLRFFCFAVRGDEGPFLLFEEPAAPPAEEDVQAVSTAKLAQPIQAQGRDEEGRFLFWVPVKYRSDLFMSRFGVEPVGDVEMLEDSPLESNVPPALFHKLPDLYPLSVIRARLAPATSAQSGADILQILVELLLEQALSQQAQSRLLAHFNAKLQEGAPLERFAELITTASPVVAIESSLPFIEETIAQIVQVWTANSRRARWVRPEVDPADDTLLRVNVPESGQGIVLLPFHSYRSMVDAERVAHEIAARDISCLIGCERTADLPVSLRQVIDLTLTLPRLAADLFETLFRRVMSGDLPDDWRGQDTHWISHVHHTDFQHPQGLDLTPEEALTYIRDRARQRLRDVEPAGGLGLRELHGLGEARRFADDLITDINEAISGRLDWEHVDRGVLLVGEPGTGKTTLARAIAKDCGIRFISASAASWQAAGHLGDHIRAMRSDFARARRFAPSILFIDEIDSIGNRETFSGQNAQYHTQVVNALLEQFQGMDPSAPVIVIAATNYADQIDPALRRAGRLDRQIEIPRPNAQALAQIIQHYLEEYAADDRDAVIDVASLGNLAIGATGADVELFVRGAARRARRAGRSISQADLIDEITRKPRDPASSPRLTPEEVRRVAVHEAGHALATFLTGSRGEDLTFISIIPRTDGKLGFVAQMPSERFIVTRQEYLEHLEVLLAGRAAEEIIFGQEGVTGGARRDLEMATKWALMMTTQYGLGPERKLLWSEDPTAAQIEAADRILSETYATVLGKLRAKTAELMALAETLQDRQELTGEEIRRLIDDEG